MNKKNYNIINEIPNDETDSTIFYNISFLSQNKIYGSNGLDVNGFIVYDAYCTEKEAEAHIKLIKTSNDKHDIYLSQIGKLYAWDDSSKTDVTVYGNKKLNDMEKGRKENEDKLNVFKQQIKNEYQNKINSHIKKNREAVGVQKLKEKFRKKMHEKGNLTVDDVNRVERLEHNIIKKEKQKTNVTQTQTSVLKDVSPAQLDLEKLVSDESVNDNLFEVTGSTYKYGIMTFYSPKNIKGLDQLCYKVRAMSQKKNRIEKLAKKIHKEHPSDNLCFFQVGKWSPYVDNVTHVPNQFTLDKLNYLMKLHNDAIEKEVIEFTKRKKAAEALATASQSDNKTNVDQYINSINNDNVDVGVPNKDTDVNPGVPSNFDMFAGVDSKSNVRELYDLLYEPELYE
jgi:hypothetical protein